jgi:hypothetical protein
MSRHTPMSKARHPSAPREHYEVAHITFEIDPDGKTFALIPGQAHQAKDRRPLFSGHIDKGMHEQLRELAYRIRQLEMDI